MAACSTHSRSDSDYQTDQVRAAIVQKQRADPFFLPGNATDLICDNVNNGDPVVVSTDSEHN